MTSAQNITDERQNFLRTGVPRSLASINIVLALAYFLAILFIFPRGNEVMYAILLFGEIFHMWQMATYLYTVWNTEYMPPYDTTYQPAVDVFITVCGEPSDIVADTVRAALDMDYASFKVHILNDGFVAGKENWQEMEFLAARLGANCITRRSAGGAKAGNINNALRQTSHPLIVVFDADHVPHRDFLRKTVGYFGDPRMGYVQSPQYYRNYDSNPVTEGAWEQQALFFGAICKGKNRLNAVTMCGTNMVIRRDALSEVGNICEDSIAEDFVTGLFIHEHGWKSTYVPEVLAEGLAPEDFLSYYKQQFRWARGALDVIFRYNFLWNRRLTISQKIQYLSSVSYFLSGVVVLANALIPIVFLFTGLMPLQISTMTLAAIFLPYICVTVYCLQISTNFSYSFKSLAFSMAGFNIHISALLASVLGKKSVFAVTSKRRISGNFIRFVAPQILYICVVAVGITFALEHNGLTASVLSNIAWALLNTVIFAEFISAALPIPVSRPKEQYEMSKSLLPSA
ncbi:MAG: glycosyltransferase [Patescibacteria group bacterium]|nr:glycosyltransferase [Patescibacteria group bacterium]MDE2172469.1 glycosyltransferase [Patescibacteria group bacterium]